MTFKTHNAIGLMSLLGAYIYLGNVVLNWPTAIVTLTGNAVGSTLPDIDQHSNRLWAVFPGSHLVSKFFRKIFLGHRSLSHSILGGYLFYKFFEWLVPRIFNDNVEPMVVIYSIMIGYISHLVADSLTEEGLPILFPLKWKTGIPPIKFMRIKTGGWFENYVVLPIVIFIIIFLMYKIAQ